MDKFNVGIIGYGHIGRAIHQLLYQTSAMYNVTSYDMTDTRTVEYHDLKVIPQVGQDRFEQPVAENDIIVVATPYNCNVEIAALCARTGKVYFDMTEDNSVTTKVHDLFQAWKGTCMTQCGLAPGAVSIIAKQLTSQLVSPRDIEIRVGALPLNANNMIKYYLSWSPEGLVNEYCNPCLALRDRQRIEVEPLEGYETVVFDGIEYEAFNTSGGIGSLIEAFTTPDGVLIDNINYKTLRYKGHREKMQFLTRDLDLARNKSLLVNIFKNSVPYIDKDVVVIYVEATGFDGNRLITKQYAKKIYGEDEMSAIQRTTAAGLCTAVHWYCTSPNKPQGILFNHMVDQLNINPFWRVYAGE